VRGHPCGVKHQDEYDSRWSAITSVATKLWITPETLGEWARRTEIDEGQRPGLTTTERERLKELEKENKELRRANEILKAAAAFFGAYARPSTEEMTTFIDKQKEQYGVEPMRQVLPIAPSPYYAAKSRPLLCGLSPIRSRHRKSSVSTAPTTRSTASARCGSNSGVRAKMWPDARWSASCAGWAYAASFGARPGKPANPTSHLPRPASSIAGSPFS